MSIRTSGMNEWWVRVFALSIYGIERMLARIQERGVVLTLVQLANVR